MSKIDLIQIWPNHRIVIYRGQRFNFYPYTDKHADRLAYLAHDTFEYCNVVVSGYSILSLRKTHHAN